MIFLKLINLFVGVAYISCIVLGVYFNDIKTLIFGVFGLIVCVANAIILRGRKNV